MGLPRYLHGHHPNPFRRGFGELREQGYKLVGDVATELGVSVTTLRRMEEAGVIPEAKRVTYARQDSPRVHGRGAQADRELAKHPGRWAPRHSTSLEATVRCSYPSRPPPSR